VNRGDAEGRDLPGARRPGGPSRRQALEGIARELATAGIESSRVEAERLLFLTLGISRADLQLSLESELSAEDARPLAEAVRRRLAGEPLQHIEGTVEFRDLVLAADRRAFVPRPETEQLLDRVLEWARERQQTVGSRTEARPAGAEGVRVVTRPASRAYVEAALDIGTGSGAIALALADEHVASRIVALDRSREALEQATENRRRVGQTEASVEFRLVEGTLWEAVGEGERFDLIVSNPPYVSSAEMERLPPEVRQDPPESLVAGEDGLDVIREILAGARDHLKSGGALFLEIGEGQGERVRELLAESGDWARTAIRKDLAGRVRFAFAERAS
jgi:release factor glutamine methyltransferase